MSEAPPTPAPRAQIERLAELAIKAYWCEALSNEPLDSRLRMDAAMEVVAQHLEGIAPEPQAAPLTNRTLQFAANEIRGVYRSSTHPTKKS